MLKKPKLLYDFQGKVFKGWEMRESVSVYMISSWTFFWLVGGKVMGSQPQPSSSNQSGLYVLVVSMHWTSTTWWGFQYLQNSAKDMAQNIIISSPRGGTKSSWLCLTANIIILYCLTVFFCFCIFSLLWLHLVFWCQGKPRKLKFYKQEAGRGHDGWVVGASVPGRPLRSHWATSRGHPFAVILRIVFAFMLSWCTKVLQRNQTNTVYRKRGQEWEVYLRELACATAVLDKSEICRAGQQTGDPEKKWCCSIESQGILEDEFLLLRTFIFSVNPFNCLNETYISTLW